jgi:putative SOS response-associated peptidase YedK
MPVILAPEVWPVWPGEEAADLRRLKVPLSPYPSKAMICWPVSECVGNVKNNDPNLARAVNTGQSVTNPVRYDAKKGAV